MDTLKVISYTDLMKLYNEPLDNLYENEYNKILSNIEKVNSDYLDKLSNLKENSFDEFSKIYYDYSDKISDLKFDVLSLVEKFHFTKDTELKKVLSLDTSSNVLELENGYIIHCIYIMIEANNTFITSTNNIVILSPQEYCKIKMMVEDI